MKGSPLFLLSAFLATAVTGQTLTYTFPPSGTGFPLDGNYALCVKGASWADVTTGKADYAYDISSTDFGSGDILSPQHHAVEVPDSKESCKGGMLFTMDTTNNDPSLELTLKARLAKDATALTVCGFYVANYPGSWPDTLSLAGFTKTEKVFYKVHGTKFKQPSYVPPSEGQINSLCRDFSPNDTDDQALFAAAVALPPTISYTFPATGLTTYPEGKSLIDHAPANMYYGICIKGAQLASTTNSFAGYPNYKMVTRNMDGYTNLWSEPFLWEKPRNMSELPMCNWLNCHRWESHYVQHFNLNPYCAGGVFLQPQESFLSSYWEEDSQGVPQQVERTAEEYEKRTENEVTVKIIPKDFRTESVTVCALVTAMSQRTPDFWNRLNDVGFTEIHSSAVGWYRTKYFCKDIRVTSKVTMNLHL